MDTRRVTSVFFCAAALFAVGHALVDITVPLSAITFTGSPTVVIPRRDTLYLNCSYAPPSDTRELASLTTMVISRQTGTDNFGQPIFTEVTAYNEMYGYTTNTRNINEAVYGVIRPVTQPSHVDLVITNPTPDQIVNYQCEVNIMSIYGHVETLYRDVHLTQGHITCTEADIFAAEDELQCTREAFFDYASRGPVRNWLSQLLVSQNIFIESQEYGNPLNPTKYYLYNTNTNPSADDAESACQAIGGYVAEINDEYEFDFIVGFTQPYQLPNVANRMNSIYLGARDDRVQNQWYFRYSDTPMPNLNKWGPGEPNGGNAEDCLVLWYHQASGQSVLGDNACTPKGSLHYSFLCEVPSDYVVHYTHTLTSGVTCSYP